MARLQFPTVAERFSEELGKRRMLAALDVAREMLQLPHATTTDVCAVLVATLSEFAPVSLTDSWRNLEAPMEPHSTKEPK